MPDIDAMTPMSNKIKARKSLLTAYGGSDGS